MPKKKIVTGGAGLIGSDVARRFVNKFPEHHIYNLDVLSKIGFNLKGFGI